jgi:hypothetical protein
VSLEKLDGDRCQAQQPEEIRNGEIKGMGIYEYLERLVANIQKLNSLSKTNQFIF